jgi:dsDNA-specific endonuclease/ATPase MutS2
MRLEEFQEIVEQYLTALQLEQIPYAIITHGHGDGVLKTWLRKTLDQRKNFDWSNIDGNDGQTRIELSVK